METQLPEAMIHQIQSFLTSKEASQTTLISKSWYNAWLTRPTLAFDQRDFGNLNRRSSPATFLKVVVETMQRYKDLNLKVESLSLQTESNLVINNAHKLIMDAIKMGATDLNLEIPQCPFVLPPEVLGSETLLRLSATGCEIDGNVNCKMLKSLSLDRVVLKSDDMLRNIFSCCNSIEELSLSSSTRTRELALSGKNTYELHKLKRLYLEMVCVDNSFFNNFESRFPCLKDLSLVHCHGYGWTRITSSSLQRISIVQTNALKAEFEVANLSVFSYSGVSIPNLCVEARGEWESHISMELNYFETSSWYLLLLQVLLTQLSPSRIYLTMKRKFELQTRRTKEVVDDVQVVGEPVAIENMRLEAKHDVGIALVGLFCICRPKMVSLERGLDNHSLKNLCEKLMMGGNCGQNMFGPFDIKEGNMEVYVDDVAEWRPLRLQDAVRNPPKEQKVRFHLRW